MALFEFDAYSPQQIAGNIVGGSVLVALVYWGIYLRGRPPDDGRA